ncbi:MAG: HpcH/HpaI aldolase/citrate lyase family protein [Rhodospirillaceae bacterium]|jgi:4-hydroxy-2-oxoheptanedioate aldolase
MAKFTNRFKERLIKGEQQIGLWSTLCSNWVADVLSDAGFDWVCVDMEHSPNDIASVLGQLQALAQNDCSALVRPPWREPVIVKRLLDAGAQSLVFPMVETADDARECVAATRYPPEGIRGVSLMQRGNRFGKNPNYVHEADEAICRLMQIESKKGLANIEEIAAVDGVDGFFFGPADLSAEMGMIGQMTHPDVLALLDEGFAKCQAVNKPAGTLWPSEDLIRACLEKGYAYIGVGADLAILSRETAALAKKYKA